MIVWMVFGSQPPMSSKIEPNMLVLGEQKAVKELLLFSAFLKFFDLMLYARFDVEHWYS